MSGDVSKSPVGSSSVFPEPAISRHIWDLKYRLKDADGRPVDATLADTWARVARAAASMEAKRDRAKWQARFFAAMNAQEFLPGGRIIAGAGTGREVTLFNCFVMGRIEDDLGSIFDNVKEAALTMQRGGGIGHDFSTLRPSGALVRSVGAGASGPVSFMDVWDAMCRTIMSAGQRRGAMMATLACDHPDIETFIDAKSDGQRLRNFNLSVLVSDAFMAAVREDRDWALQFAGTTYRTLRARALWDRIMRATYDYAEPGVIFIDRVNERNNLAYCETIRATNPCGEQPLPAHGACLLGSVNLARLVRAPFSPQARLDEQKLGDLAALGVRLLDNVIDVSAYPLKAQQREAKAKRRIGLGITGLADALIMCGLRYGSPQACAAAARWMAAIKRAAYLASAQLAAEKGVFPLFEPAPFLASPNVVALDEDVRDAIGLHGIRNGCLTSIAPTGTISLLAGNVSGGVEPVFDLHYMRRIRGERDTVREETVEDYAHAQFQRLHGAGTTLPPAFVTVGDLAPSDHLAIQSALQPHVDSAISKTVNCPPDLPFEAFRNIYAEAFDLGLKGCTTFRPNAVTGAVLAPMPASAEPGQKAVDDGRRSGHSPALAPALAPAIGSVRIAACVATPALASPVQPERPAGAAAGRLPGEAMAARGGDRLFPGAGDVVYMSEPLMRETALAGYTYKLKWGGSDHALYVTINDIEQGGRRRPFEIFINTRNLEHYAWTVALTRMISAVFRRGGDVTFVVDELKAIFDPQGGQWIDGRYVPSLLALIGDVIERHMRRTGFLQEAPAGLPGDGPAGVAVAGMAEVAVPGPSRAPGRQSEQRGRLCPRCGSGALVLEGGCWMCRQCGYSKCG